MMQLTREQFEKVVELFRKGYTHKEMINTLNLQVTRQFLSKALTDKGYRRYSKHTKDKSKEKGKPKVIKIKTVQTTGLVTKMTELLTSNLAPTMKEEIIRMYMGTR